MPPCRSLVACAGVLMLALVAPAQAQGTTPAPGITPAQPSTPVHDIQITGAHELDEQESIAAAHLRVDAPLPVGLDRIDRDIERRYRDAGYTFARAHAAFDEASGRLTVAIDEGVIDAVEFQGVNEAMQRNLAAEFAVRAGDVFMLDRALQALQIALRPTRGALEPGVAGERGEGSGRRGGEDSGRRGGEDPFDLVDRGGQRVLLVGVRERTGRFRIVPDLGEREDWFTSVDGFVPSVGFGAAVFDREHFNHSYVAGHLSFKTATDRAGYALGFERPFFAGQKLFLGGELHDLTASDDMWRVSSLEASLAAVGPRRSFRDYYRRRGVQITGAWRVRRQLEVLFAWRGERQERLAVQSDFSFWNNDETFRSNTPALDGRLNAVVAGASLNHTGFDAESLEATYRRHQLEAPFGAILDEPVRRDAEPVWRIDWTSEISTPGTLGSDFDFRRHIVSARLRKTLSPHQDVGARAIGGWSGGVLPPQRRFAIGGIGSVHGYTFKEAEGDALALVNLEYSLGWGNDFRLVGFFDAGRVAARVPEGAPPAPGAAWLKGVGFGVAIADALRIDFGYKLDAVPSSLQVLLRFGRTF